MTTSRAWLAAICLATVACDAGAAGSDPGPGDAPPDNTPIAIPSAAEVLAPGPHAAGVATFELVDDSRPTPPNGAAPGSKSRRLPMVVWYPADKGLAGSVAEKAGAAPDLAGGPWPLIVYCHGFMSFNRENDVLAALLATRGYVVAAPEFPLTHFGSPGGENAADVVNQPGDVKFVIDTMLARNAHAGDLFHRLIDPSRIGLMGVSLGGLTAAITTFHKSMRDDRVKVMAAAAMPGCYLPADFFADKAVPILMMHGTMDLVVPFEQNGPPSYSTARPPRCFVKLDKGTHTAFGGVGVSAVEGLDNPDMLGCLTVEGNASIKAQALADLSASFGGKSHDDVLANCPAPCTGPKDYPPAMKASRQVEVLYLAMIPFIEHFLGGKDWGAPFLEHRLSATGPDLSVQYQWEGKP